MFVQVIQGRVTDPAGLRKQWERWQQDLKPSASGFLGSTAGITPDGEFIALVRFESEEAARANSDRAQQGVWWQETSQYLTDVLFHDCREVDLSGGGGSDEAGFVQVIQGKVTDMAKAREIDTRMQDVMKEVRPDVIGGIVAWHPGNGRFTNAIYFTSETEARVKEKEMESAEGFHDMIAEFQSISDGEPKYLDLPDPWLTSN